VGGLQRAQEDGAGLQRAGGQQHRVARCLVQGVGGGVEVAQRRDAAVARAERDHAAAAQVAEARVRRARRQRRRGRVVDRAARAAPQAAVAAVAGLRLRRVGDDGHARMPEHDAARVQRRAPDGVAAEQDLVGAAQRHRRLRRVHAAQVRREVVVGRARHRHAREGGAVSRHHLAGRDGPAGQVVVVVGQRVGAPAVGQAAGGQRRVGVEAVVHEAQQRVVVGGEEAPRRRVAQQLGHRGRHQGAQVGAEEVVDRLRQLILQAVESHARQRGCGVVAADVPEVDGVAALEQRQRGVTARDPGADDRHPHASFLAAGRPCGRRQARIR
jgi:hypothetical protein